MDVKRKPTLVKELAEVLKREKQKEDFIRRITSKPIKKLDCQGTNGAKGKICFPG